MSKRGCISSLVILIILSCSSLAQICTPNPPEVPDNAIDEDCNGWIDGTVYNIRSTHPRMLLTDDNIPVITARIRDSTRVANGYYQDLLSYAIDSYDDSIGSGYYDYPETHLITFSFIYALGEIDGFSYGGHSIDDFGNKAKAWLRVYSEHLATDGARSDYAASEVYDSSLAYDWIYPVLTDEDKEYILPRLITASEAMRASSKYWFSDYTLGGYSFTALGMAAYGDHVVLDSGQGDTKMKEYLDLFVSQYLNESFEMWKWASMGGGSFQSMTGHSGDIQRWAEMLEIWHTATGQDLIGQFDMLTSWPEWWVYGSVPYLKNMSDTSSSAGDAFLRTDNENMYSLLVPNRYWDAVTAAKKLTTMSGFEQEGMLLNWWLDSHGHAQYTMSNDAKIYAIIWYDDKVASKSPSQLGLSLTKLFGTMDGGDIEGKVSHPGGAGIVIMKSAWEDPDATLAVFKPRPFFMLHQDIDSNSFIIFRKGYLAVDSGKYIDGDWNSHESNYDYRSIAHNVMNIYDPDEVFKYGSGLKSNDAGQRIPGMSAPRLIANYKVDSPVDIGGITRLESVADKYDYIEGDATRAYQSTLITDNGNSPKVSMVKREFVYLRSPNAENDFFLVFDMVNATSPGFKKSWIFHSLHTPEFTTGSVGGAAENTFGGTPGTYFGGDSFSVYDKGGRLFVKTISPASHTYKLIGGPDSSGNVNTDSSYEFYVDGTQYPTGTCSLCIYRPFYGSWRVEDEEDDSLGYQASLHVLSPRDIEGMIIDNNDPGFSVTGSWSKRYDGLEYYGSDFMAASGTSGATATWTPNIPYAGDYDVYIMWNDEHDCTDVPYRVSYSGGTEDFLVDQTVVGGVQAGDWYKLGTFSFASGSSGSIRVTASANCPQYDSVVADAVRLVRSGESIFAYEPEVRSIVSGDGRMSGAFMPSVGWLVMFSDVPVEIAGVQYSFDGQGSIQNLITGLKPGTTFRIFDNGNMEHTMVSSQDGTLYFQLGSSPSHSVTISETQPQQCSVVNGECMPESCSAYDSCSALVGLCSQGYCCQGKCIKCAGAADKVPCDGCISNSELNTYINTWLTANSGVSILSVIEAIKLWKLGC